MNRLLEEIEEDDRLGRVRTFLQAACLVAMLASAAWLLLS